MTHRQYTQLEFIVECSAVSINAAPPFNARTGTTLTNGRGRLQPGDQVIWDIDVENGTYHCNYGVVTTVTHQARIRGHVADRGGKGEENTGDREHDGDTMGEQDDDARERQQR